MIVGGADLFATYDEFNNYAADWHWPIRLNRRDHPEHPALILLVRKWRYEGLDPKGPDLSNVAIEMRCHVPAGDKWDIFIYERSEVA